MNLQLVCDDRGRITYYIVGWPGSVYDSTVLHQAPLALQFQDFFLPGQYLLADAGYASTTWCVTPYRNPAAQSPINQVFNELFSSARCRIEHVNGVLKNRFSSLKGLRICIRTHADFQRVNLWILVCLLLHNLLIEYNNPWEVEEDITDSEEDDNMAFVFLLRLNLRVLCMLLCNECLAFLPFELSLQQREFFFLNVRIRAAEILLFFLQ